MVGAWGYAGWIVYQQKHEDPEQYNFVEMLEKALRSDHGETRIQIPRSDGKGVNIWFAEVNTTP